MFKPSASLNNSQKIMIFILVVIVISIGLILFLTFNIKKINGLYVNFLKKKSEVQSLIASGSTSSFLANQLESMEQDWIALQKSLLVAGEEITFIQSLENLSREYNIKQSLQLSTLQMTAESGLSSAELLLNVEGDFYNFLKYLVALEGGPYYININIINLSSDIRPIISKKNTVLNAVTDNDLNEATSEKRLAEEKKVEEQVIISANLKALVYWQNLSL